MKTLLTVINRNKNHESHKVQPYSIENQRHNVSHQPSSSCDCGTFLMYVFGYVVCNCIFCPICFLIWSPVFYYIKITIDPRTSPPTLSPTYGPRVYPTISNYTY